VTVSVKISTPCVGSRAIVLMTVCPLLYLRSPTNYLRYTGGRRFNGCACVKPCTVANNCACAILNKECDPDLCKSCGVVETTLSPGLRTEKPAEDRCSNCALQTAASKKVVLGRSIMPGVGFGLFAGCVSYVLHPRSPDH
jgi:hypothetical protein